ncbi:anti-sigma factor [Kitasatospora sp. DSM 101779]|uniref:anti-sigma factor n=1 Tax=Kitasatospora sp. DSM 101779 TaxID=2853165 RepID=UPI0021DAC364|nr:anti-sigma factor [Kitasatospora sp. DSM 101779]MCU7820206.1 anti-sigma factor [Kitasatospora sp. DSM 101779]
MNDTADLHTLSGAYALHALGDAERSAFERHLARCEPCRTEIAGFAATLARLGLAAATVPPPGMEDRAMAALPRIRQLPPRTVADRLLPERVRRRPGRTAARLALAACLALTAVFGGLAVHQHDQAQRAESRTAQLRTELAEFGALLAAPDVRSATASTSDGSGSGTAVWSRQRDRAAFLAADLPPLPAGRAWELWLDKGGAPRPAGLLHTSDGTLLLPSGIDGARALAVSQEPATGSPQPTTDPVLLLPLP